MEPGFWPTKSVKLADEFAGSAACAECHRTIAASQFQTSMAKGLLRAIEIPFMHDAFTDHKIQIAKAGQSYVE